jgi:predicted RNA-binding Zn ribbon-like protein
MSGAAGVIEVRCAGAPAIATPRGATAPGALALVQRFVNSVDMAHGVDLWQTPAGLAAWIEREGWGAVSRADRDDLRRCVAVREAIRELLLANAGATLDRAALAALNRTAGNAPLRVAFDGVGTAALRPMSGGIDRAIGDVLAAVVAAQGEGIWTRLKACREENCLWAFFDHSKNGSGMWCSMAMCGNRAKARRYRARRRATAGRG